ncbi:UNVERIFIED_CONTAM: hypothetical protein FKN15_002735 [Acipenser sinensis]
MVVFGCGIFGNQVYIIQVSWSDGSTENIYRRYSKFFDLQMELLDKFPVEGGQKDPKQRIIPFLPGKILFRRSHIRDVAIKRLRPIDEYCGALIQLPVYISQCEEVRQFFETRPEDINPPKEESIGRLCQGLTLSAIALKALIQLPVYISQCEEVRQFFETRPEDINPPKEYFKIVNPVVLCFTAGDFTAGDPLLLDQYVAVTDYEKQESSEVSLFVGQVVEVIEKNESGWWFVSSDDEQGWVPATCLEAQDDPDDFSMPADEVTRKYWSLPRHMGCRRTLVDLFITSCGQGGECIVVSFVTVRLHASTVVLVLHVMWSLILVYQGQEGWAPASYLKKADLLTQKLASGCPAHSSASDLDGFPRQANAAKERDNTNNQKDFKSEACFSPFADVRRKSPDARHRPPPRRDLTIPRGLHLPKPPIPPQVEEEYYTIADFQTTIPDGISFQAGMKVEVIEKNSSGWWYIQIDEKEGWAPITFIDKYKKTSNATRPNFLAPLPNEMAQLKLEDGTTNHVAHEDDPWISKPLPDDPSMSNGLSGKPKLKDWKTKDAVKGIFPDNKAASNAFSGAVQTDPICPSAEEKPALPPRRESINKSLEVEFTEKQKHDLGKGLPPKQPAPGVILPMMPPKPAPFKGEKVPDPKKEDKNKVLYLRNEMGLECGHKVSAKEVKKFNLKPVAKPEKSKPEPSEEKPEPVGQMMFAKPKPQVRPKPIPSPRMEGQTESKVDITNLRSRLKPAKPTDKGFELDISQQEAVNNSLNNVPSTSKGNVEPKIPPKQHNGHGQNDSPKGFPGKPVPEISTGETEPPKISVSKEAPQRPTVPPRRPPPPKKSSAPSSPTEAKGPIKDLPEMKPSSVHHRPVPPKPKALIPPPSKDESKLKGALGPKLLNKQAEKPDPPKEKLPSLWKEGDVPKEKYVAVADFEGDEQTSGFKEGTVFDVQEKNSGGTTTDIFSQINKTAPYGTCFLALGPKLLNKQAEKPDPPKEKLPSLWKEGDVPKEKYVAVADFEGDEQTSGFKEGTVFDVQEKNSGGSF